MLISFADGGDSVEECSSVGHLHRHLRRPTYLPGHCFKTRDDKGNTRTFNLIDGGLVANNPTFSAMSQVTMQILKSNRDYKSYGPLEYKDLLAGDLDRDLNSQTGGEYYCRDKLSVGRSTEENLNNLVEIGKKLLQKPVSRVNLETGQLEPVVDGCGRTTSNEDRLVYFARRLSDERKLRQERLASTA